MVYLVTHVTISPLFVPPHHPISGPTLAEAPGEVGPGGGGAGFA